MTAFASRALVLAVLAGTFALGACKKDAVNERNATPGEVASRVAESGARPQPGRWESTLKLEAIDMPGMPPEAKAMMQKSMGTARTLVTCLSPEGAARPAADFFNQGKSGCTYDAFKMADGHLDATMTCKQGPEAMKITLSGSYGADAYEVHTHSTVSMPDGKAMTQSMTMTSRRTGDCKGDELNAKKS
ncbi:MAG: DUF3617 domain-containing protein [Sphingomonadales bacterium]|nr:DUF3617 domain-containing protein [Sphingomonadales bacterium]